MGYALSGEPAPGQEAVIHVVDDDDAMRDSLSILLDIRGFEVRTYESAVAFLASAPAGVRSCLITDVQMPQMTGIELLQELRRQGRAYPAIVLCGRPTPAMEASALAEGAIAFFAKPFDPAALTAAVHEALQGG
jgi:two-component system response regulator FixJ